MTHIAKTNKHLYTRHITSVVLVIALISIITLATGCDAFTTPATNETTTQADQTGAATVETTGQIEVKSINIVDDTQTTTDSNTAINTGDPGYNDYISFLTAFKQATSEHIAKAKENATAFFNKDWEGKTIDECTTAIDSIIAEYEDALKAVKDIHPATQDVIDLQGGYEVVYQTSIDAYKLLKEAMSANDAAKMDEFTAKVKEAQNKEQQAIDKTAELSSKYIK